MRFHDETFLRVSYFSKVTGYGLDDQGSISSKGRDYSLPALYPDWLFYPTSLLSCWYWGPFLGGKAAGTWS
jgi:hypothetical protein